MVQKSIVFCTSKRAGRHSLFYQRARGPLHGGFSVPQSGGPRPVLFMSSRGVTSPGDSIAGHLPTVSFQFCLFTAISTDRPYTLRYDLIIDLHDRVRACAIDVLHKS